MSRIGKKPVAIPGGVIATVNGQEVKVKGPKGELKHVLVHSVMAELDKDEVAVTPREDTQEARAMWGMSRTLIANLVAGVTAAVTGQEVQVKGPKGVLKHVLVDDIIAKLDQGEIEIAMREDTKVARAMWGMSRTMVANLIAGVTEGFAKKLEITGVGYRAALQGANLQLQLGYSHDIAYPIPQGIQIQCPKPTEIIITGIDKQKVGQVAAEIRRYRPPEPYKGKGIRYAGEFILRKEGKKK